MTEAMHPGRVAGKTAIVTGGSGELGAATVRLLVQHGARVANFDPSSTVLVPRADGR
ncbi:hypothetical protein GCM10009790_06440 [Georgenia ruanii]